MFKQITFALLAIIASSVTVAKADDANNHGDSKITSSVVKSGQFEGRNRHVTTGGVSIVQTASGYVAILESDFSLDGAPAPTLGFGNNRFDKETEFTKLESDNGLQVYAIPDHIDPSNYSKFYVWCADFNIALGVSSLK